MTPKVTGSANQNQTWHFRKLGAVNPDDDDID
jgi:hypothetical protein